MTTSLYSTEMTVSKGMLEDLHCHCEVERLTIFYPLEDEAGDSIAISVSKDHERGS